MGLCKVSIRNRRNGANVVFISDVLLAFPVHSVFSHDDMDLVKTSRPSRRTANYERQRPFIVLSSLALSQRERTSKAVKRKCGKA